MEKKRKINKELLLQVREAILEHPEHFQMDKWFNTGDTESCQTTACIAGWTYTLSLEEEKPSRDVMNTMFDRMNSCETSAVRDIATKLLGLTYRQANELFYWELWDKDRSRWHMPMNAKQGAMLIDNFLAKYDQPNVIVVGGEDVSQDD